ncbi:lipopolysaccharide biosynthesis protein [Acaryochloris sp. IP29b_bin.148]|uniref:lipopolysaccharide biosynthesis protein n=1 Tax=Acaryochloris sp. IP29b_bin.148 TaxID=2969218 RepID=UPI00260F2003|nr:lipopolysaccharide biosynthesis protein [Acaryochloris sp. IP29b_bin.148]
MSNRGVPNEKNREFFKTEHLQPNLKRRSIQGGLITVSSQGVKFALTLISNICLARLLTPADHGLVSMVMAVIGFMKLFKDLGLSMATVQRKEINHAQVSTLFWINLAFSLLIGLITVILAPVIAQFYQEPRLVWITIALASGIVISGLGTQHIALLQRQMQYSKLAACELIAQVCGVGLAIVAALQGMGYWALVIYPIATATTLTLGALLSCGWIPGWPSWDPEIPSMLKFGGNLTGFTVINYCARNVDNILIGKYLGKTQLGLYAKAYQLLLLPIKQINGPIRSVAIPLLSRLSDSPEKYRRAYIKIVQKLMLLTVPLVAFMMATSDWLIAILLGKQWIPATPIFLWLGLAGAMQPVANSVGWLLISQGQTDRMLIWGIISTILAVTSFGIGLPWGATGVAASYALVWILITMPLLFWFVGKSGPVRTQDFYVATAPIILALITTAAALLCFRFYFQSPHILLGCLLAGVITISVFIGTLLTFPSGRAIVQDSKDIMKNFTRT